MWIAIALLFAIRTSSASEPELAIGKIGKDPGHKTEELGAECRKLAESTGLEVKPAAEKVKQIVLQLEEAKSKGSKKDMKEATLLLASGKCKKSVGGLINYLSQGPDGEQQNFLKRYPQDFFFQGEINYSWYYTGREIKEVAARFPRTAEAEEALYELTEVYHPGECEGWIDCSISWGIGQNEPLLTNFPSGKYAPAAIAEINSRLKPLLNNEEYPELKIPDEFIEESDHLSYSRNNVKKNLDRYLQILKESNLREARAAEELVGKLLWRMGFYEDANSVCQAVVTSGHDGSQCKELLEMIRLISFKITGRAIDSESIRLGWHFKVPGIGKIVVYRGEVNSPERSISELPAGTSTFVDSELGPDILYYYRVLAHAVDNQDQYRSDTWAVRTQPSRVSTVLAACMADTGNINVIGKLMNNRNTVLKITVDGTPVDRTKNVAFLGVRNIFPDAPDHIVFVDKQQARCVMRAISLHEGTRIAEVFPPLHKGYGYRDTRMYSLSLGPRHSDMLVWEDYYGKFIGRFDFSGMNLGTSKNEYFRPTAYSPDGIALWTRNRSGIVRIDTSGESTCQADAHAVDGPSGIVTCPGKDSGVWLIYGYPAHHPNQGVRYLSENCVPSALIKVEDPNSAICLSDGTAIVASDGYPRKLVRLDRQDGEKLNCQLEREEFGHGPSFLVPLGTDEFLLIGSSAVSKFSNELKLGFTKRYQSD